MSAGAGTTGQTARGPAGRATSANAKATGSGDVRVRVVEGGTLRATASGSGGRAAAESGHACAGAQLGALGGSAERVLESEPARLMRRATAEVIL